MLPFEERKQEECLLAAPRNSSGVQEVLVVIGGICNNKKLKEVDYYNSVKGKLKKKTIFWLQNSGGVATKHIKTFLQDGSHWLIFQQIIKTCIHILSLRMTTIFILLVDILAVNVQLTSSQVLRLTLLL